VLGAFTAFGSFGIGEAFNAHGAAAASIGAGKMAGHVAAHAALGCASAAAAGGSCKAGAMAAGFSALAGHIPGISDTKLVGRMLIGGVASKLGGGEFANGALSAAFEYLYNYCSAGSCTSGFEPAMYDYWPGYKAGTLAYNQTFGDGSWTGWEVVDAVSVGAGVAGVVAKRLAGARLMDEAISARDALAESLKTQKNPPATVTAGYKAKGEVVAKACGGGKCAEDHVANALGKVEKFTPATRPRTGNEVPICLRCEATYGRSSFPSGTRFRSD
jgi:hypothetical protein